MKKKIVKFAFLAVIISVIGFNYCLQSSGLSSGYELHHLSTIAYAGDETGEGGEDPIEDPIIVPTGFVEWIIDVVKSVSGEQ